jgi:hypothetical protein
MIPEIRITKLSSQQSKVRRRAVAATAATRRLAEILAADAAGYSHLVGAERRIPASSPTRRGRGFWSASGPRSQERNLVVIGMSREALIERDETVAFGPVGPRAG